MKDIQRVGWWWLPGRQEPVAGTLSFSVQDGIRLKLTGSLTGGRRLTGTTYPLILGITAESQEFTLCECRENRLLQLSKGFLSQEFYSDMAFAGAHFTAPEQVRFRTVAVQYSHLTDWVHVFGIKEEWGEDKLSITYTRPEEVTAETAKGIIRLTHGLGLDSAYPHTVNLRPTNSLLVEVPQELPFDVWQSQFIRPLQNLLSLATSEPNAVTDVIVHPSAKASAGEQQDAPRLVRALYRQFFHEDGEHESLHPVRMLFSFREVVNDFSSIVERWLKVADELDSVCNLFFSVQYNPRMYLEQQFLSIIQAIETYHRRRVGNKVWPQEEFRQRVRSIVASAPQEYRAWLQQQLQYGNEPHLKERLRDLLRVTDQAIIPLIGDEEVFVREVGDTRNFYTHYDSRLRVQALHGNQLGRVTRILSFLIQACLLRELGFPPPRCTELIQRTELYRIAVAIARDTGKGWHKAVDP